MTMILSYYLFLGSLASRFSLDHCRDAEFSEPAIILLCPSVDHQQSDVSHSLDGAPPNNWITAPLYPHSLL